MHYKSDTGTEPFSSVFTNSELKENMLHAKEILLFNKWHHQVEQKCDVLLFTNAIKV